jgi:molybdenum cofactor cytidylyltransferase
MKEYKAVILAAGISKRLGFNKLRVRIDGERVIQKSVKPFLDAGVGQVIIVTGTDLAIAGEFTQSNVVVVENRNHMSGMSTSVIAALPFVQGAFGVFFHLGDKPFLDRSIVEDMARTYEESRRRIVVPVFREMKGHPILMDVQRYPGEIDYLSGDKGLREIIENHSKDVIFIKGNEGSLFDLDTREDIEYLIRKGHKIEES